jgi:hypothetical protein
MKYTIFFLSMLCALSATAQHASIDKDTVSYNGKKYCIGDTVHLGYGSGGNKDFAFVQMGGALMGLHKLDRRFSKADVVVTKTLTRGGKIFLRGKATEGMPPGYNVFIEVEGAVDNKEVRD